MIIDQQNVSIHFLMAHVLQQQFLYCFTWSSNQLFILNIFSFLFLQTFLLINSISLSFDPWIFSHLLGNLFRSFWQFLMLFWMLRMLITMHKPCNVSHASQLTTSGTILTEIFFSVSKEWFRYWSHAFLKINIKILAEKLLAVHPEKGTRRKKRKKTRMEIAKLFTLNVNAIKV